jgi:hypothetical protein
MSKKGTIALALAGALSFGAAIPAYAGGTHDRTTRVHGSWNDDASWRQRHVERHPGLVAGAIGATGTLVGAAVAATPFGPSYSYGPDYGHHGGGYVNQGYATAPVAATPSGSSYSYGPDYGYYGGYVNQGSATAPVTAYDNCVLDDGYNRQRSCERGATGG